MSEIYYRAWGRPDWIIPKFEASNWVALCCIGTEKRSVTSALSLCDHANSIKLIKITDPAHFNSESWTKSIEENTSDFVDKCRIKSEIKEFELKASLDTIAEIVEDCVKIAPNLILDVTSFPKRWFFPIIRMVVENPEVENFLVNYTRGEIHAKVISENPEPLRVLPSFPSLEQRKEHDLAFIGVGFHSNNLTTMFGDNKANSIQLLFPFPPGPPEVRRNWSFVEEVERIVKVDKTKSAQDDPINFVHINSVDVSQTFDAIRLTTNNGRKTSIIAPYGPKPHSVAMCLYSIAIDNANMSDVPIYYSQPQKYAVEYTKRPSYDNNILDSWTYAIKKSGKFLYKVE